VSDRPDFTDARNRMVDVQIAGRGIRHAAVLQAMRDVPREAFVDENLRALAYEDSALPIDQGQAISQPYVVGLMLEAADIKHGDRVLEVGAGSGYVAALLSRIAGHVCAMERRQPLVSKARDRLTRLGYDNVDLRFGDGMKGWPEAAIFDAILVSAGRAEVPPALKAQLAVGGRLVMPVGPLDNQTLLKLRREDEKTFTIDDLGAVAFVPLVGGEQGL
jgi:protein-L-isoaspartate(D-aspartate) O-methyltransferase